MYWLALVLQVGLLNVDGYYNSLLTFIDKAVEEGFINPSARRIIVLAPTAQELMEKLEVDNVTENAHAPEPEFIGMLLTQCLVCNGSLRSTCLTTTGSRRS